MRLFTEILLLNKFNLRFANLNDDDNEKTQNNNKIKLSCFIFELLCF